MIRVNYTFFDEAIEIKNMTILSIEDTNYFSKLSGAFYSYEEDGLLRIFNEKQDRIKKSDLVLVTDIMGYSINSAPILKRIYDDLQNQINNKLETKIKIEKLIYEFDNIINNELLEHELELVSEGNDLLKIFKILGIKIYFDQKNIFEKMFEIIKIFSYMYDKNVLVFINTLSYFTYKELLSINEYINLNNINVLFIEPRKINVIKQIFIDSDYIMFKNMI